MLCTPYLCYSITNFLRLRPAVRSQVVIQILDCSLLVWLGTLYAPMLPFFGLAANIVQFYVKKLLLLYLYTPPKERHSASRTNVIIYCLMLGVSLLKPRHRWLRAHGIYTPGAQLLGRAFSLPGWQFVHQCAVLMMQ